MARRILLQLPSGWKTTISVTSMPLSLNVNVLFYFLTKAQSQRNPMGSWLFTGIRSVCRKVEFGAN